MSVSSGAVAVNAVGTLMNARSVAVVGASTDPTRISGRPLHFLLTSGYSGRIYAVNPRHDIVQGVPSYSSVLDLPEAPEVAILAVPAHETPAVMEQCAEVGTAIVVVTASGFGESGVAGRELQSKILETARAGGVRVLGPNCLGAFNSHDGLYATFSQTLANGLPEPGPVAVVSQSGAYGSHLAFLAQQRRLDIGYWITTGNEADINVAEALEWYAERDDVRVIMLYVEGVRDGERFLHALERAREAGKPVIALKAGTSEVGAKAAGSHTGALAGTDEVYDAVFKHAGVYRAASIEEQLDITYACARGVPKVVRRLGVVTVSGGIGALIADAADRNGLYMPPLDKAAQDKLLEVLPFAGVNNPIDCTGQALQNTRITSASFAALLDSAECDAVLGFYSTVPANAVFADRLYDAMLEGIAQERDALIVMCMVAGPAAIQKYESSGVLVFEDPDRAVRAISALSHFGEMFSQPSRPRQLPEVSTARLDAQYNEHEAKKVLASVGVPIPVEQLVHSGAEAVEAAARIGHPVALKVASREISHKSDIGGVSLGLVDDAEVERAFGEIVTKVGAACPDATIDGVLVAPMAEPGVELIVGGRIDPVFGPVVMVGIGGIFVETLRDVDIRLAPVGVDDALSMLDNLKGGALLRGLRGREPADRSAAAECIAAISRFIALHRDQLSDLEVNPLLVHPEGQGVTVLDAVISVSGQL